MLKTLKALHREHSKLLLGSAITGPVASNAVQRDQQHGILHANSAVGPATVSVLLIATCSSSEVPEQLSSHALTAMSMHEALLLYGQCTTRTCHITDFRSHQMELTKLLRYYRKKHCCLQAGTVNNAFQGLMKLLMQPTAPGQPETCVIHSHTRLYISNICTAIMVQVHFRLSWQLQD